MTLQAWINKPKNQKLLFLVIGVILLYLYLKNKDKAAVNLGAYTSTLPGSAGGRTDGGSGSTGIGSISGNFTPVILSRGYASLANFEISGSSNNWRITDLSTRSPAPGYEWYYIIGEKVVRQSGRLIDAPWQTNLPGHVLKHSIKVGLTDLSQHASTPEQQNNPYYDPNGIEFFDKGDVGAQFVFAFVPNSI